MHFIWDEAILKNHEKYLSNHHHVNWTVISSFKNVYIFSKPFECCRTFKHIRVCFFKLEASLRHLLYNIFMFSTVHMKKSGLIRACPRKNNSNFCMPYQIVQILCFVLTWNVFGNFWNSGWNKCDTYKRLQKYDTWLRPRNASHHKLYKKWHTS